MSSVSSTPDGGYSYYAKALNDLESDSRDETRRAQERYEERAKSLEKNYEKAAVRKDQETEETLQRYRNEASTENARVRDHARDEVERAKAQTYDKFGRSQSEIDFHKKRADEAIRQSQEELVHTRNAVQNAAERGDKKRALASEDLLKKNAEMSRSSREREAGQLRHTISDLVDNEGRYAKEKGQGMADGRREVEDEYRTREAVISHQFEQDFAGMKRKSAESDRYFADLSDRERKDREMAFAGTLQKLNQRHHDDVKILQANNQQALDQAHELIQKTNQQSENSLERQSQKMNDDRAEAMKKQAQTFTQEKLRLKAEDGQKIQRLEDHINRQMSSADPTYVSPAAEAALRQSFTDEYEKKHRAEVQRHTDKSDQLKNNFQTKLTKTTQDAEGRITRTELQKSADAHIQRQTFLSHIDEIEHSKELAIKNKDYQASRHEEAMNRNFGTTLDRQKRDYESLLDQMRTDFGVKIAQTRQQAEIDSKMAQRKFNAQQSDLIRSHERKMDEQKNNYEDAISNLKEQLAHVTQDADRRTKQLLDDQQKGYEQKIAQLEYQSKERERTISDNYQDQMEKIKRSNALLIQRKSEKS